MAASTPTSVKVGSYATDRMPSAPYRTPSLSGRSVSGASPRVVSSRDGGAPQGHDIFDEVRQVFL